MASAPAAFRVRVWHLMSRGQGPAAQRSPLEGARVGYPLLALESCRVRVRQDAARMEFVMMMEGCGMGMMVMMWVAGLLGLALLASLIVLLWVVIGRLRRQP